MLSRAVKKERKPLVEHMVSRPGPQPAKRQRLLLDPPVQVTLQSDETIEPSFQVAFPQLLEPFGAHQGRHCNERG
jgi:hypothetical protein